MKQRESGEEKREEERGGELWEEKKAVDDVCRLRTGNRYKLGGFKNSKDRQAQSVE